MMEYKNTIIWKLYKSSSSLCFKNQFVCTVGQRGALSLEKLWFQGTLPIGGSIFQIVFRYACELGAQTAKQTIDLLDLQVPP